MTGTFTRGDRVLDGFLALGCCLVTVVFRLINNRAEHKHEEATHR